MKNIKVMRGIALTWHPLSVNFYSLIFSSVTAVQISKNSSTLKPLGQMNRHWEEASMEGPL
jgi:hypothetical protein